MTADLCLVGGRIVDVRSGALRPATVAIRGSRITDVGVRDEVSRLARQVLDVTDRIIVPGYIEPHTHVVLATPVEFARAVLPGGTTTAVVDALPFMMVARQDRLPQVFEDLAALPLTLRWLIRLHPQSFSDTDRFSLAALRPLWRLPSAAAVGEVTRWVDVHQGDPELLEKIRAARADGQRVEGHAAGASYEHLTALAVAGFTSCHEAATADEARDRMRAGLYVMLRHSPIRPDLPELAAAVTPELWTSPRLMLTADGPTPAFIEDQGYMEYIIDVAIRSGIPPMTALRMATLNPAAYYGMDDRGEVAPGKRADLNILRDLTDPHPEIVIAGGQMAGKDGRLMLSIPEFPWEEVFEPAHLPRLDPGLFSSTSPRPVTCRLLNDVITELITVDRPPPDSLQAVLIDRRGRWSARLLLSGFVNHLGGLATTTTSAFDLLVLGQRPSDMAQAAARLADFGGGLIVVEEGAELFTFPLDIGGVFSSAPWPKVVEQNRAFNALMRARGFRFTDPIFSLTFLTFDSLPWVRLTSRGVWDVRHRRVLTPASPL